MVRPFVASLPLVVVIACGSHSRSFAPVDGGPTGADGGPGVFGEGGAADDGGEIVTAACDADLPVFGDAGAFAKAIGICQGLVSATFTRGYATTEPPADGQHGVLDAFGKVIRPREGKKLGVLSTGWARAFDDVSATSCDPSTLTHCFKQGVQMQSGLPTLGAAPPGYPQAVSSCAVSDQQFDAISVKLSLKVPAAARGVAIDFDFFSGEWPDYVCTKYNDGFVVLVDGANVAFDSGGRALSVNNAFFDRCTAATQTGCRGDPPIFGTSTCGGDLGELEETGFYVPGLYCNGQLSTGGGSTGWLTTQVPVTPGATLSMELLIWDSGDPKFDSSVVVDHFRWVPDTTTASTSRVR